MQTNDKILFSAIAILVVSIFLVWAIIAGAFTAPSEHGWLYNWQTLIGALLALVAGGGAVWAILYQTNERREAADRRLRLARAFRAGLAEDCSALASYARESARICGFILRWVNDERQGATHAGTRDVLVTPTLPRHVMENLRSLVENLEAVDAKPIGDLLRCFQVQRARLDSLIQDFNEPNRIGGLQNLTEDEAAFPLGATAELYVRGTSLFPYARGQLDTIEPVVIDSESMSGALSSLRVFDLLSPEGRARLFATMGITEPASPGEEESPSDESP
jgi:hypothetical protein